MKRIWFGLALGAIILAPALSSRMLGFAGEAEQPASFAGRWDLTIRTANEKYPSWIEVLGSGADTQVQIVGRVASVHPATNVKLEGKHLRFQSTEYLGKTTPVSWDLTLETVVTTLGTNKSTHTFLTGTQKRADGVEGKITGSRAPTLDRPSPAGWSEPGTLFDGKDLNGWEPDNAAANHWTVEDGELVNTSAGANIRTVRTYDDFKLHIEYSCPEGGNSGVYLRGRYEVQVEYEPPEKNDKFHQMGSIYGFIPPAVNVPKRPGQWESYDIILVGRTVTVVRDDVRIIDAKAIPGITGGALDSNEAAPGPIVLQGDHTGGMKYRNIHISVPKT